MTAVAVMAFASSCVDEVKLPNPMIKLSVESITAPSLESAFNVTVESNCDWQADVQGAQHSWIMLTDAKNVGNGELSVSLTPNTSSSQREAVILVHNESGSMAKTLVVKQNPQSGDGIVTISELRSLGEASSLSLPAGTRIRGVVVSNMQNKNYPDKLIAMEGSTEAGNGITVRTRDELLISQGQELEVNLDGASLSRDADSGLLILTPADDAKILRTDATVISPTPVEVTIPQLASGDYESMYVKISGQFSGEDTSKDCLYEGTTFIDTENNSVTFRVLPDCGFADATLPSGSGYVCGVAAMIDGAPAIYPATETDIALNGTRIDGGFYLPYIFSLMTNTATNSDGRYIEVIRVGDDLSNSTNARTLDNSGVTMEWDTHTTSKYFRFWTDNSGHHNFQIGSWMGFKNNHVMICYPSGQEYTEGFRIQLGWAGQTNAYRNWEVQYSTGKANWSTGKTSTLFSVPEGMVGTAGKGYPFFTIDVYVDKPIRKEDRLYVKIIPHDNATISGAAYAAATGRAILHSCLLIDKLPSAKTTKRPGDAIYFEAFDALTEGADYRLGDKLAAMLNYAGSDIASWSADQLNGMSGKNVCQRPGYAQIGFVNTVDAAHTAYKNAVGELITPRLGVTGSVSLSFRAMCYRNKASFKTSSTAKDINGDMTTGKIEILNGGTINGQTSLSFGTMNADAFRTFNFVIEGVTAETQIKFTSAPASSEYSRWFIDNIYVK